LLAGFANPGADGFLDQLVVVVHQDPCNSKGVVEVTGTGEAVSADDCGANPRLQ